MNKTGASARRIRETTRSLRYFLLLKSGVTLASAGPSPQDECLCGDRDAFAQIVAHVGVSLHTMASIDRSLHCPRRNAELDRFGSDDQPVFYRRVELVLSLIHISEPTRRT